MTSTSKIAVITGAGSGIGRATALELLRDGWRVALAGRRQAALEETLAVAGADGARALVVPTDVADPKSVEVLFSVVVKRFGRVDMLFNNAGRNPTGFLFEDLPFETWKEVIDVNLTGSFLCAQAAFRVMKTQDPRGGRIINNGSLSAHVPRPDSAAYTASKHAILGLTRTLALDGRKYDIACCQIDIGNAFTGLSGRMKKGVKQADGVIRPEPMIDVMHVARSVLFMANQPLEVNVHSLMVMATTMPYAGRG